MRQVSLLLGDDHFVQLLSHKDSLYGLTSFGFILQQVGDDWVQVSAPISATLAQQLQEATDVS